MRWIESTVVLTLMFAIPAPRTAHGATQEAAAILDRAEEAYEGIESLRATFYQVIEVPLLDRMREGRGLWYQKGRNLFMMDFSDPEGDVLVTDGRYLWAYYPSQDPKQVVRSEIDSTTSGAGIADFHSRILDEARTNFTAQAAGIETGSGLPAYLIILTPKDASPYRRVRLWIDLETFLIRRFEFTELSETVRTIELDNIQLNVEIEDHIFQFDPPPGAEVFKG